MDCSHDTVIKVLIFLFHKLMYPTVNYALKLNQKLY